MTSLPRRPPRAGALLAACLFAAVAAPVAAATLPAAALPPLDLGRAVAVDGVTVNWEMGTLELLDGILVPAPSRPQRPEGAELLFVGHGRLHATPPNATEAGQLELFSGGRELDVDFTEAVLVSPTAGPRLLGRGKPLGEGRQATAAQGLWQRWQGGPYRRLLGVESTLFGAALGDPWKSSAFVGLLRGGERGDVVAVVDPSAGEQVTIGQFVPIELTRREEKAAQRLLHREQRQGRLLGVSLEQLGRFDTWMSTSLSRDGKPRAGFEPVTIEHYEIDVSLGRPEGNLRGAAKLRLQPAHPTLTPKVVTLQLHGDLVVDAVRVDGAAAEFVRDGDEITVALPAREAPAAFTLEVSYAGQLLQEREGRAYSLRDALAWYPRTEELYPATWDVRLEWPARLTLVASGQRADGGERDGRRWERRTIATPAFAFGVELGNFDEVAAEGSRVPVRLYLDRDGKTLIPRETRREIVDTAADALAYFEERFGPYPFGSLSLVTSDQPYSQAMPGVITLSHLMMADFGGLEALLGLSDRKAVVAHEVAHQWWGHQVGWASYRDVWISEAVANFAALAYARERLDLTEIVGPTAGWEDVLTAWRDDDRPLEAVGPIVLGPRLDSTKAPDAYQAIVYQKGAVVLDMLTQRFGEATFLEMLGRVAATARGKQVSTESFLAMLESLGGTELDTFAERFVYGTGLPEVYYEAQFSPLADGRWRIQGEARLQQPYRFRYRAVRDGDTWDVRREQVVDASSPFEIVVPFKVPVLMADGPEPGRGEDANAILEGRLVVQGERTAIDMEIDHEPKELWLDPDHRVFGRFWNARRSPRRMAFYEALDLAALGKPAEAEERLAAALALPLGDDDDRGAARRLDARIQLELARLALDRGDDAAAAERLRLARDGFSSTSPWRADIELLELRSEVRRGDHADAAKRLAKTVRTPGLDSTEAYVLLAIAAKQSGRAADLVRAREVAAARGADLSALD